MRVLTLLVYLFSLFLTVVTGMMPPLDTRCVGFIGLGTMGEHMAGHVAASGIHHLLTGQESNLNRGFFFLIVYISVLMV
jgi:hypothetical protein